MRIIKDDKGEAVDRVFDFPDVYDGDYLYFHYLYRARHYSDEFNKGLHGAAIKCRGRGFEQPNSEIVMTPDGIKTVGEIKVGDYLLDKEGLPTKVLEVLPQGSKEVLN